MVRYAARCSYRGCKYHGFQIQLPARIMRSKRIKRKDEIEIKTIQVCLCLCEMVGYSEVSVFGQGMLCHRKLTLRTTQINPNTVHLNMNYYHHCDYRRGGDR